MNLRHICCYSLCNRCVCQEKRYNLLLLLLLLFAPKEETSLTTEAHLLTHANVDTYPCPHKNVGYNDTLTHNLFISTLPSSSI